MSRRAVAVLALLVLLPAVAGAAPAASERRVPILVYHHIRPAKPYTKTTWSWKMSVSPAVFEQQMRWLTEHGYVTVSMDALTQMLDGQIPGPSKPVVITFDDNNQNAYAAGLPVLRAYGLTATWYVVTNWMNAKSKSYLSPEQVRELAAAGMDIQSHTVSHAWLTNLSQKQLDREFFESRRILEELSGRPVRHIAYPSTMQNKAVRARAAQDGYVTGVIMDPRSLTAKDDRMRLPRIMMTDETKLAQVLP